MSRLVLFAALLALVFTADCGGPPCVDVDGADVVPVPGAWDLRLEQPRLTGPCQEVDTDALVRTTLRAELGVVGEDLVHLDLDGVHLEGRILGDTLYAEGWSDAGFMEEQPQGLRLPLGVVLDARLADERSMEGELLLIIEAPHGLCEATARFQGQPLPWSEGQPVLCEAPVPADPDAPIQAPEAEDMASCG